MDIQIGKHIFTPQQLKHSNLKLVGEGLRFHPAVMPLQGSGRKRLAVIRGGYSKELRDVQNALYGGRLSSSSSSGVPRRTRTPVSTMPVTDRAPRVQAPSRQPVDEDDIRGISDAGSVLKQRAARGFVGTLGRFGSAVTDQLLPKMVEMAISGVLARLGAKPSPALVGKGITAIQKACRKCGCRAIPKSKLKKALKGSRSVSEVKLKLGM